MFNWSSKQRRENRRRRRERYDLDVKVRSQHRAQEQTRHTLEWLAVMLVAGLVIFGAYRAFTALVAKTFTQNAAYSISTVMAESDGALTREEILGIAGVKEGQNLFAVDLAAVRMALEGQSMIRRAEVRRVLPDKLAIKVSERVPVAQLYTKATLDPVKRYYVPPMSYLIDAEGVVMKSVDPLLAPAVRSKAGHRMPLLEGVDLKQVRPGSRMDSVQVQKALSLVHLCETGEIAPLLDYDRIDVSARGYLVMITRQSGQITFSTDDLPGQLKRLQVVLTHAVRAHQVVRTCDLTVRLNVPVTFFTNTPAASAVALGGSPQASNTRPQNSNRRIP